MKEAASFGGLLRANGRRVAAAARQPPARAGRECAALISIRAPSAHRSSPSRVRRALGRASSSRPDTDARPVSVAHCSSFGACAGSLPVARDAYASAGAGAGAGGGTPKLRVGGRRPTADQNQDHAQTSEAKFEREPVRPKHARARSCPPNGS